MAIKEYEPPKTENIVGMTWLITLIIGIVVFGIYIILF